MKQNYHKILFWFAGTAVYFLAVAFVLAILFDSDVAEFESHSSLADITRSEDVQSVLGKLEAAQPAEGVLMPIGPDDPYLPGLPEVWAELMKVADVSSLGLDVNGFDGLQMVRNVSDLGRGSIAEIFISSRPVSVARVDNVLLVLNSNGRVQVVDCEHPRTPALLDPLPYPPIEKMIVEGGKAFLLLKIDDQLTGEMVVLDLSVAGEVEELARLVFPGPVINFFFVDGQLLTYESRGSLRGEQFLNVYSLSNEFDLLLKAKIRSPIIDRSTILLGQHLITPDLRDGLKVVNLNGFQEPLPVVNFPLNGQIRRLARFGDQLFAVEANGQLCVVDLHNLENPTLAKQITGTNYIAYYLNVGDYSYYFAENGYLRVYETPIAQIARLKRNAFYPLQGTFAETSGRQSLLFLSDYSKISHVNETLAVNTGKVADVVDVTSWDGYSVLLDKAGGLSFLRMEQDGSLTLEKHVTLPGENRWLAAGETHLYAGGSSLEVVGYDDSGDIVHMGTAAVPRVESTDGVVVDDLLFVAAGRKGVKQYSIKEPSLPEDFGVIKLPIHLESLADVRQLSLNDKRLLAAAGPAGLFEVVPGSAGGRFEGGVMFQEPLIALTTINDFCLVSDKQSINVIDLREKGSLQKLGEIAFVGVERFVAANNGLWAGFVQGEGWTVLPAPEIVTLAELSELIRKDTFSDKEVARYRLRLFDDNDVVGIPGVLSMTAVTGGGLSGEVHVAN